MLLTLRFQISFTLLILFLFKAGPGSAQPLLLNRKVSLSVSEMPLNLVLQRLSKETGIHFSYDPELISSKRKITIHTTNQPLGEVMNQIFASSDISFREVGSQLVIFGKNEKPRNTSIETIKNDIQNNVTPLEKRSPIPDTIVILHSDTIQLTKTDTLVRTETIVQHDTIRLTDTIYLYKTQKAGKLNRPKFDKNSLRNQKYRENNGFYTGISYQQLFGKPSFSPSSDQYDGLAKDMRSAALSASIYSIGIMAGYNFPVFGIQSGLHYTRLGETFEYDYSKQIGGYYKTDTVEKYYILSDPDTIWTYVTDSSWVNLDYQKFTYKNPNAYRYLEIPILAMIRIIQREKLEIYAFGGAIAGINIGRKALYIKPDVEKSVAWVQNGDLKPVIFSYQAGLGTIYYISDRTGFLIEASYRNQMTSMYKDYPLSKKFQLVNIKTGIFVRL